MMKIDYLFQSRLAKIGGLLVTLLLVWVWCSKGLASAEMASWIQAIGSLIAIAIAIQLARASAQRDDGIREAAAADSQRKIHLDRQAQIRAACLLSESVCEALLRGYGSIEKRIADENTFEGAPIFAVRRGREAIGRIPTHEIPYTIIGKDLLNLAIHADRYIDFLSKAKRASKMNGPMGSPLEAEDLQRRREKLCLYLERFKHTRATYDGVKSLPTDWEDI